MKKVLMLVFIAISQLTFAADGPRVLYDFEDPAELKHFSGVENVVFDLVQDNGVTRGRNCARVVFKKETPYAIFELGPKAKDLSAGDYIAFDIFQERDEKITFNCELWDALTKNYATRCTYEQTVRPGKQTVLFKINRAKRNGKEGRDWEELEPADKINMKALTKVRCFLTPPKDSDLVWWVDNIRLLTEDQVGAKMKLALPAGAKVFDFGPPGTLVEGFTSVTASSKFDDDKGYGFTSPGKLADFGKHFPDPLTGDGVWSENGEPFSFDVKLPDGEYFVWLCAGPVYREKFANQKFVLKAGSHFLVESSPDVEEYFGEKHYYRFMNTSYSPRPNAQWLSFIDQMYPVHATKLHVADGKLSISLQSYFLSALVVLPAADAEAFTALKEQLNSERLRVFNAAQPVLTHKPPSRTAQGDQAFEVFIPDEQREIRPDASSTEAERKRESFDLTATPGQNVIARLAITAFENLDQCRLMLNLKDAKLDYTLIYLQDHRAFGDELRESALRTANRFKIESGTTACIWIWLRVAPDAVAGEQLGSLLFQSPRGELRYPFKLTIHPFKLERDLPYSFGMYYNPPNYLPDPHRTHKLNEQLEYMRQLGMTATSIGSPHLSLTKGKVYTSWDNKIFDLAEKAGMGRHPAQMMMASSLGPARAIARGLGVKVDNNPGSEFKDARFKDLYMDYARQYAALLEKQKLPVAVEIVDEPREVPNPWNRNLEHTNLYGDWLKAAGVKNTFVTPMGDTQSGKDYSSLVDHADIVSTHAGKGSERLMKLTHEKKKTLWLYNTGMDRFSWGFYNWRVGSVGRWEWHFNFPENTADTGYLGEEWYNPFVGKQALAPHAPLSLPGAMLFQSAFLRVADGITDSAYIYTLEKTIERAAADPKKTDAATRARAFLDGLKKEIPFLPDVKGLGEDQGALVGQGVQTPAALKCEHWRRQIAKFLIDLQ